MQQRTPAPTGYQGDVVGTVAVDANYLYVCTSTFDSTGSNLVTTTGVSTSATTDEIVLSSVSDIIADIPVIFSEAMIANVESTTFGNITSGTVYYVKSVVGANSAITISDARTSGTAGATFQLSTQASGANTSIVATFYKGSNIWKKIALTSW